MDITVKQLQTFIGCPLQHQFLFLENKLVLEEEPHLQDKIHIDLKELIEYTYTEELLGHITLESVLRNRLALMWRTKINPLEHDYKVSSHGSLLMTGAEKLLKGGYDALHRFVNWRKSRPIHKPMSVNESFRIPCGRHYIVGQLPVVRYCPQYDSISILDIRASAMGTSISEEHHMLYTSWCMAIEYIYGKPINEVTVLWTDRKGRNITSRVVIQVWRKQYLKRLVDSVGHAMQLRVVYPIKGGRCSTCPFTKECDSWLIYGSRKPLFTNREGLPWEEPKEQTETEDIEVEEVAQLITNSKDVLIPHNLSK